MTLTSINNGVKLALATTREHKMRSFLTVLGVIIGTGAVIGVGSIIAGLDGAITGLLTSFGPNTVIVTKTTAMGQATREERRRKPLTYEDARAIAERCPAVAHVSPFLFAPGGIHSARYKGNDVYNIQLGGTEEGYAAGGTTMKFGRFFSDFERPRIICRWWWSARTCRSSCCPTRTRLASGSRWTATSCEIVGVMDRPANQLPGQNDTRVLVPYFTMHKMFPNAQENMLIVIAYPGMIDRGAGPGARRAAPRAPRAVQRARQLLHDHRRADDRAVSQRHRHGGAGDGDPQLDRPAGGRHRGHEHHAGERHRAHPRDRHPQGRRRAQDATSSCSSSPRRWCSPRSAASSG